MIQRETRIKILYVIKRVAKKMGIDIPKEVEETYWTCMRLPNETSKYLIIDYDCLDTDFIYHSFDESDLKGLTEQEKIKKMFEHYFIESGIKNNTGITLLLINIETLKAYTIIKEIKYTKKEIK